MSSTIQDKQFLFIVGAPRSGTTWLQIMLGEHPQVCTSVELTLFDRYIGQWMETWRHEVENAHRPGLNLFWTEQEFHGFLQDFIYKTYERALAAKPDATHVLDKRPSYSEHVETIQTLLPNARFIHIIRDGRDVATSMMAAARDFWFQTDTMQKAATRWNEKVRQAQIASRFAGQYLEIRYEDLLEDGVATLKKVFDFCGLPVTEGQVGEILEQQAFDKLQSSRKSASAEYKMPPGFYRKGKAGNWQEELSTEQQQQFDEIAGELLRELGYAGDHWVASTTAN